MKSQNISLVFKYFPYKKTIQYKEKSICNNNDFFSGYVTRTTIYSNMHTQNISEISSEIHKKTTMKKKEGSKMLHKNVTTSKSYLNLFSQTGYGKSQKYSLRTLVYF